jgi:hypothetical protein
LNDILSLFADKDNPLSAQEERVAGSHFYAVDPDKLELST